jgi:hypothetical protein
VSLKVSFISCDRTCHALVLTASPRVAGTTPGSMPHRVATCVCTYLEPFRRLCLGERRFEFHETIFH